MANDSPNKRPLRTLSFVIHATRGVIRDPVVRRKTMFVLLVVALVLLVSGATFLQSFIHPREHPFWFIFFWLVCAWVTVTAMLLAIFDLLMLRLVGRRAERRLRENLKTPSSLSPDEK
jgi:protein-S-isoprenylcysteine O-methyltransferase Ste14